MVVVQRVLPALLDQAGDVKLNAAIKMLSRGSGLLSPPRNRSRLDCGKVVTHSVPGWWQRLKGQAGLLCRGPGEGQWGPSNWAQGKPSVPQGGSSQQGHTR